MRRRPWLILHDPSPTDGGGAAAPPPAQPDYAAALAKHNGDANAMAMKLYTDFTRAQSELSDARKRLPADGSRVLSAEDAARYDAWAALGDPAEVSTSLKNGEAAIGRVRAFEREKLIGQAATAHGFNADVLATLAGPDLAIELKDVTLLGKPARAAEVVVTTKGADGKEAVERTPLDKYAEKAWPAFAASLSGKPAAPALGTPTQAQPVRTTVNPGQPAPRRRSIF